MKTRSSINTGIVAMALILNASAPLTKAATTYVSWGGDYVSQVQLLQGDVPANRTGADQYGDPNAVPSTAGPSTVGRFFSDATGTAFNPASGYTGPVFYGGGSVTNQTGTNEGFHELAINNSGPNDSIHWQVDSIGVDHHTNHVFIYFDKSAFNSPFNTITTLSLSNLSSFSLSTGQMTGSNGAGVEMRWVVQNESQFWISQNVYTLNQNSLLTENLSAVTGWATYSPTNGSYAGLDFDPVLVSQWQNPTFNNVLGMGFYVEHENPLNQTQATHVDISAFAVEVPEPSRLILAGAGMLLVSLRRRREPLEAR